jgi:hypothetical protein
MGSISNPDDPRRLFSFKFRQLSLSPFQVLLGAALLSSRSSTMFSSKRLSERRKKGDLRQQKQPNTSKAPGKAFDVNNDLIMTDTVSLEETSATTNSNDDGLTSSTSSLYEGSVSPATFNTGEALPSPSTQRDSARSQTIDDESTSTSDLEFFHYKPRTPFKPFSSLSKASFFKPPVFRDKGKSKEHDASAVPLPPPRPPTVLPSPQRPPLFDLNALSNLGKAIYSVLTDPSQRPVLPASLDLESLTTTLATSLATTAAISPNTIPVITNSDSDGLRVIVKVDITNPSPVSSIKCIHYS